MLSEVGGSNWEIGSSMVDKENASPTPKSANSKGGAATSPKPALTPGWLFKSAMITAPVDLSALVTMSRDHPQAILEEFGLLNQMVAKVLNAPDTSSRIDKATRLDVVLIFGNLCLYGDEFARDKVKKVLAGVSTWFEKCCELEKKATPSGAVKPDPELHKAMLVLLARAFEYKLKTEDLLELTGGNRSIALESCVGVLEDGEVIVTEIAQKAKPQDGKRGQWEEKAAVIKHEKELVLQMCELLQGFTRAESYFSSLEDGFYYMEAGLELPEYCIDQFGVEIDMVLHLTMETKLVEKLAKALNRELFSEGTVLATQDHQAIAAVNSFIENMYLYGCGETETFRAYLLTDTLLVPQVVIPYLEACVYHAAVLSRRAAASKAALANFAGFGDLPDVLDLVAEVSDASLDYPELVAGVEATLRTLIIASFRAPRTRMMFQLLQKFNPTASLLRMKSFVSRHDYIFSLLCLLNVNMGAFDITGSEADDELEESSEWAYVMLAEVLTVFEDMPLEKQRRVLRRIEHSGALPVARDTPSYQALLGIMWGGGNAAFGYDDYPERPDSSDEEDDSLRLDDDENNTNFGDSTSAFAATRNGDDGDGNGLDFGETAYFKNARADAKADAAARAEARSEDQYLEELIRARVDAAKSAMLRTGRDLQGDNWVDDMMAQLSEADRHGGSGDSEGEGSGSGKSNLDGLSEAEMERLDALVHADLMACQAEMRDLEAEVQALQLGCYGDDDDVDSDDDDGGDESGWSSGGDEEDGKAEEAEKDTRVVAIAVPATTVKDATPESTEEVVKVEASMSSTLGKEPTSNTAARAIVKEIKTASPGAPVKTQAESKLSESDDEEETKEGEKTTAKETHVEAAGAAADSLANDKAEGKEAILENPAVAAVPVYSKPDVDEKSTPEQDTDSKEVAAAPVPSSSSSSVVPSQGNPSTRGATSSVQDEHKEQAPIPTQQARRRKDSKANKTKANKPLVSGPLPKSALTHQRSLLGDLPSLEKQPSTADLNHFVNLKLELPKQPVGQKASKAGGGGHNNNNKKKKGNSPHSEMECAINGHMMKDPVRAPNGLVFERATILVWLETRGQVCPISGKPLTVEDLTPDTELRKKIMRRHIATSMGKDINKGGSGGAAAGSTTSAMADDLYDF